MYIYNAGFIPIVPSQNHIPNDFEINHFRRIVIQGCAPHLTQITLLTVPGQHHVSVVLWSTTRKFQKDLRDAQLGGHVPQFVPRFNQLGFVPRLNVYHRVRVIIHSVLSQPVEIAIQMDSCLHGDVGICNVVRMTQIWHVFLCTILPRDADYVIAGICEVLRRAWLGTHKFFRFRDHSDHWPIVPLQFPPHGVETEFDQTSFGSVIPDRFFSSRIPSLVQNDSTCLSTPSGL